MAGQGLYNYSGCKVRIFSGYSSDVQEWVNDFLKEMEEEYKAVHNIEYSTSKSGGSTTHSVMIIYS